jgi:hypothetical protein
MVDTDVEGGNFIVSSVPSRNLWTKADNWTEWWEKYTPLWLTVSTIFV